MSGRFTVSLPVTETRGGAAGRVGFIVDGLVPCWRTCLAGKTFRPLLAGWPSKTAGTTMRFGWVAEYINSRPDSRWCYELYRPWRSYRALVFVKSMNVSCRELAARAREKGCRTVFDANVDYFSPASGTFYYEGMEPTAWQREESCAMAGTCDGVIADSRYLFEKARPYNRQVAWIPDNVRDAWIAPGSGWRLEPGKKLPLLWSGEAVKLFELLRIEPVLRRLRRHLRLCLVTGSLDALSRIFNPWQDRLRRLLSDLDCEIVPFRSIPALLTLYDQGGVSISPRFLDNSYNMGHTEWKISLAMARGRIALASPQPSYCDLYERASGQGVRLCTEEVEWEVALTDMLGGSFPWVAGQEAACVVVRQHYATSVVAERHAAFLKSLLSLQQRKE